MDTCVIGISHHTAAVAQREAFALDDGSARRLLRALASERVFDEAMVLSTCNRTEAYFVTEACDDPIAYLLGHIAAIKGDDPPTDTSAFYHHRGPAAVRHLFRVAAALDSQIVGEHEILGQLKDAYSMACQEHMAGLLVNRLAHRAFRVGKRVRAETHLGRGSASVARTAVQLARQVFDSFAGKSALLIGAGKNGELIARAVVRNGAAHVVVANRSRERARDLAGAILRFGDERNPQRQAHRTTTESITLDRIPDVIGRMDLVISSTGSPDLVLTRETVGDLLAAGRRSVVIVDIAVPRDVDAALGALPNVFLHNIDDLDRLVARNLESRRMEIPRAEAIVAEEVDGFVGWFDSLKVAPTIRKLQDLFSQMQAAEVSRYGKKFTDADQEQLEQFARGLCNKILHHHVSFLRDGPDAASAYDRLAAVDAVRRIFGLEQLESEGD